MWRQETGFMEMFLAYFDQLDEKVVLQKTYRDFLFDLLCLHEETLANSAVITQDVQVKQECFDEADPSTEFGFTVMESNFSSAESVSQFEGNLTPSNASEAVQGPFHESVAAEKEERAPWQPPSAFPGGLNNEEEEEDCKFVGEEKADVLGRKTAADAVFYYNEILKAKAQQESHCFEASGSQPSSDVASPSEPAVFQGMGSPAYFDASPAAHSLRGVQYPCKFCGKVFCAKSSLKIHERVHTGERPYKCKFCPKRFSQSGNWQAHERIHKGERPFVCKVCKKSFVESGNLRKHERTHFKSLPVQKPEVFLLNKPSDSAT